MAHIFKNRWLQRWVVYNFFYFQEREDMKAKVLEEIETLKKREIERAGVFSR